MTTHTAPRRVAVERSDRIMATTVSIHVACAPRRQDVAAAAVEACLEWLREVERQLTRFDPQSELCRLNAAAGEWHAVSDVLLDVLAQSLSAAEASDGLFDPTLLPLLEALGYDRDFSLIEASESGADKGLSNDHDDSGNSLAGDWRAILLDRTGARVRLPAGTRLDLGGIVKGWAADRALERFFKRFPNVLINVGGDMRARGEREPGEPWAIGVGNPRVEGGLRTHVAVVSFSKGAIATSGATDRWWHRGGKRLHHLLDPRTSEPARVWIDSSDDGPRATALIATATAFAPTAAQAEVAAKVALLRGYPAALRSVEAAWTMQGPAPAIGDAGVALLLVLGSGEVVYSANLPSYLATVGGGGDLWLD